MGPTQAKTKATSRHFHHFKGLNMSAQLEDIANDLLKIAKGAGADSADTLVVNADSVTVEVRKGKLEHIERSEGTELGLRVFVGQRQACVSGSDLSQEAIAAMAEQAVAMAKVAPQDDYAGLAEVDQLAREVDGSKLQLIDEEERLSTEQLRELAIEAESAALSVAGVSQTESSAAGCGFQKSCMAASNGFTGSYESTGISLSCAAISGSGLGMEVDYCYESRVHSSDLPAAEAIGLKAGQRAASRAGATRPPTGAYPILFDERISSSLVGHLLSAINGSAISRGASWLLESLNQQVLPNDISLFEDPELPRQASSKPFDGEGLKTFKKCLVKNGQLQGWILDLATARKLNLQSTANASRNMTSPPSPNVTNICLPDGERSRAELIADMGTGLIVTSLIGSTINPTTGDYSRGGSGFWVENGQIGQPVSEFTIAGNLKQFLKTLVAANDSRPFRRFRVPSLLVDGLTIAGQ